MWLGLDARFRDWKLTSPPFVVYVHEKVWKYHAKIGEIWVKHKSYIIRELPMLVNFNLDDITTKLREHVLKSLQSLESPPFFLINIEAQKLSCKVLKSDLAWNLRESFHFFYKMQIKPRHHVQSFWHLHYLYITTQIHVILVVAQVHMK